MTDGKYFAGFVFGLCFALWSAIFLNWAFAPGHWESVKDRMMALCSKQQSYEVCLKAWEGDQK